MDDRKMDDRKVEKAWLALRLVLGVVEVVAGLERLPGATTRA